MAESIIIALSGKKGSGKDTLADIISDHFRSEWGCRSVQDAVSQVAFADLLKAFCIDVLGLQHDQCYGSDEKKNTPTEYKWVGTPRCPEEKVPFHSSPTSSSWRVSKPEHPRMTAREVMQVFGTECVRSWFGNVWAEATIRKIRFENPRLAIITDARFPSEVETVLAYPRGYIVRLTRSPYGDDEHVSETSLDDYDWERPKCYVLDNAAMGKQEQAKAIIPILGTIFKQELG